MGSEAVIYLSGQRGSTYSPTHRSLHTFNFGSYQRDHKRPFRNLAVCNDDTLMQQASLTYFIPDDHLVFLLPVIGGFVYKIENEAVQHFVDVGQSILLHIKKASILTIINEFQNEPINFICCWFSIRETVNEQLIASAFELDASKNSLVNVSTSPTLNCHIGKFSGRHNSTFKTSFGSRPVFAFVLEGAFEFQNRLLEQRDGLSLTNISELEFEALSNEAILLLFELC